MKLLQYFMVKIKSLKAEKTAADVFGLGKINENLPTKKIFKKDVEKWY